VRETNDQVGILTRIQINTLGRVVVEIVHAGTSPPHK